MAQLSASLVAKRSVAFCVSKASYSCHLTNRMAPFSATAKNHVQVNIIPEEDQVRETKISTPTMPITSEDEAGNSPARAGGSGSGNSRFDGAKGTIQKVEDTVVAEADENVVDTTEYRSMEDMRKLRENSP